MVGRVLQISDYEVKFKIGRFFKIWLYHICFFTFNLMFVPVIMLIDNYNFARNMMFIGCTHKIFGPMQHVQSAAFIGALVMFYLLPNTLFHPAEMFFPILTVLSRSLIIAVRYASMSNSKYSTLKSNQNFEEIGQDLLVQSWQQINFQTFDLEFDATKYRLKIELDDFNFNFLTPVSEDTLQRYSDPDYYKDKKMDSRDAVKERKQIIKDEKKGKKSEKPVKNNSVLRNAHRRVISVPKPTLFGALRNIREVTNTTPDIENANDHSSPEPEAQGKLIMREIAILDQVVTGVTVIALLFVMVRLLISFAIIGLKYSFLGGITVADILIFICINFLMLTMHMVNLVFVTFGLIDFKRKLFFQKIMGALINAERKMNDPSYIRLTPIINVLDPDNLRRWMTMRRACIDLGLKFTLRVFLYSSIFIVVYGLFAAFLAMAFFELVPYKVPIAVTILGMFDILVILGTILQMIKIGAEVNLQFIRHKEVLITIKRQLIEIKSRYEALEPKTQFISN